MAEPSVKGWRMSSCPQKKDTGNKLQCSSMDRGKTKEFRPSLKCPIQLRELKTLRTGSSDKDSMYVIKSV